MKSVPKHSLKEQTTWLMRGLLLPKRKEVTDKQSFFDICFLRSRLDLLERVEATLALRRVISVKLTALIVIVIDRPCCK